ncbi:MBL fold metallo-hydrolase [Fervidibacillus halotolerans]|uniref:MBL fold metallo-hydrolase n=1 Tax=Fervidibacillus halotolerans TaxID=2980027 RepID=A0A9E8LXC4_9BACI|nr:MBL fold metallo-hydrolase [Fervidibacillus halotolerans]WAA11453.1 MBL fold metallo-hydrolase [Fervidibacillus halotolerans]
MEWERFVLGPLETNGYCFINEDRCLFIDPGNEAERIIEFIKKRQLKLEAILLTHAHFDHIGAADDIRMEYGAPLYVHEKEMDWLDQPMLNGSGLFFPNNPIRINGADESIRTEGRLEVAGFSFQVFETPGHSPGSVSFYFKEENLIVCGDTLFAEGIGRTDLPGGDFKQLMTSIQQKLLTLPDQTVVLPGHGPITNIGKEKKMNPFIS